MLRLIAERILQSLVTVLLLSFVTFIAVYHIGNPLALFAGDTGNPEDMARAAAQLGIDRPFYVQYLTFLTKLASGDFGISFVSARPAFALIMERLPATVELTFFALFIAVGVGIPLGVVAGVWPKSLAGRGISALSILLFSVPGFWFAILLIVVFAISLGWLPSGGRGTTVPILGTAWSFPTISGLKHMLLPAMTLSLHKIALIVRLTKSGMQDVLMQDYIRYARLRGIAESRIICVHALRNILIPIVTTIGIEVGSLLGGSTVVETIFAWPGIGKLLVDSIRFLDRPVVVAYVVLIVLAFITINLLVDIAYVALDPRLRKDAA